MTKHGHKGRNKFSSPRVYLLVLVVVAALVLIGVFTLNVGEVSPATSAAPGLRAGLGSGFNEMSATAKSTSAMPATAMPTSTTKNPVRDEAVLNVNKLQKENGALQQDVKVWRERAELYSEYATSLWARGKVTPSALNVLINAKLKKPTWGSVDMVRFRQEGVRSSRWTGRFQAVSRFYLLRTFNFFGVEIITP